MDLADTILASPPDRLAREFQYVAWVDGRLRAALRACPDPGPAVRAYARVLAAEYAWHRGLREPGAAAAVWPHTLAECEAVAAANAAAFAELVEALGPADLGRCIPCHGGRGAAWLAPLGDVLTHVVMDGALQRGLVAKEIVRGGGRAPGTSYLAFARQAAAGAAP